MLKLIQGVDLLHTFLWTFPNMSPMWTVMTCHSNAGCCLTSQVKSVLSWRQAHAPPTELDGPPSSVGSEHVTHSRAAADRSQRDGHLDTRVNPTREGTHMDVIIVFGLISLVCVSPQSTWPLCSLYLKTDAVSTQQRITLWDHLLDISTSL